MLTIVAHHTNSPHTRIFIRQALNERPAAIGTAIVDQDNFVIFCKCWQRLAELYYQWLNEHFPFIDGNNDGEIHSEDNFIIRCASQPDAVFLHQYRKRPRHLSLFLLGIPAEYVAKSTGQLFDRFAPEAPQHREQGASKHKIVEVANLFMLHKEDDLTQREIGQ